MTHGRRTKKWVRWRLDRQRVDSWGRVWDLVGPQWGTGPDEVRTTLRQQPAGPVGTTSDRA
jgi:hypothetical protein